MEECASTYIKYEKDYSKASFNFFKDNLTSVVITIYGDMFQYKTLNGLYLSSSNISMSSYVLDLYSNVKSISGRYPPISVFPVKEYDIVENYILTFKLPENLLAGNYDIIYFNDAGYFKASNTKGFTYFTVNDSLITPTPTPTYTPTTTPTPSLTPSVTPSFTPTQTETPTNTPTPSVTPSFTPTQTETPTNTPTPSVTPSFTPTNTPTGTTAPLIVTFSFAPFVDNDGDGYSNSVELAAGTDPNDINSFPISLLNIFNNI